MQVVEKINIFMEGKAGKKGDKKDTLLHVPPKESKRSSPKAGC